LEKWQVRLIEKTTGQELKEWGYGLSDANATIPLKEQLKYYKGFVGYRLNRWFVLGLDRLLSLLYPWPLSYKAGRNNSP
jgi:hypothetical protein